jgi:hypothetical protein
MADQLQKLERRKFWQYHLDAWTLTELSQVEYCRQNNLQAHRFTYWKRKFYRENLPVELVQIHTAPVKSAHFLNNGTPLRLTMDARFTLEIPDGFSPATLEQVISTLQEV